MARTNASAGASGARRFDWARFTICIYIAAPPAKVYDAWTTARGLCSWFLEGAAFFPDDSRRKTATIRANRARAGDRFIWTWFYKGGTSIEESVIAARAPGHFRFGFGDGMEVEVRIERASRGAMVTLVQHNIPTSARRRVEYHMGCRVGWTFFLANLKSVLEGGADLREKDPDRLRTAYLANV